MMVELRKVPRKIIIEAYISGSMGGPDSRGGLDGFGPMVLVDIEKREMVPVPGFQGRLEAWRKTGQENPCRLKRKPTLKILNSFVNHEPNTYFDMQKRLIVNQAA